MCGASPLCGVRYWGDWSGLRARCIPAVIADEKQKLHPDIRACDGTSSQPAPGQRGTAGWLARNEHTCVGVAARQSGRAVWSGRAAERAGAVHLRRHGSRFRQTDRQRNARPKPGTTKLVVWRTDTPLPFALLAAKGPRYCHKSASNAPVQEGAFRRGVPQGEQQLGRLGVAPPQTLEAQSAKDRVGVGGDAVDGRDEARLVLADDELHVRVRGELERARRHARAHPLAEGVGRDRRRAARLHLPDARLRSGEAIDRKLGGALVRAKVEQAKGVLDDHARRLLEEAPAAVAVQARVRVGGALGRRVRHEQRVRVRVKVPGVDGSQRDAEARAVLLGGEGLLRQAEEVDHHADRAVRRVALGLGEHDLQEGQQPAQLRAEPVGVEPVEPRVREHEDAERVLGSDVAPQLEAPEVALCDEGGGRHVLPAARHDAAALGEGDDVVEVDERRVVHEGLDGAAAKEVPAHIPVFVCCRGPLLLWRRLRRGGHLSDALRRLRGRRLLLRGEPPQLGELGLGHEFLRRLDECLFHLQVTLCAGPVAGLRWTLSLGLAKFERGGGTAR
eukprot:scaffold39497_cov62-Phaeocystis_antarctica.AAC.1